MVETGDLNRNEIVRGQRKLIMASFHAMNDGMQGMWEGGRKGREMGERERGEGGGKGRKREGEGLKKGWRKGEGEEKRGGRRKKMGGRKIPPCTLS